MAEITGPEISVIIPSFNRAKYLPYSLQSVLSQTFHNFEVLIIDDGSTDNTREVVSHFSDSRVRYEWQPHSGRPAVPRNTGIRLSRGRLIAFLDSDDIWLPQKLEKQLRAVHENPEAVLFYSFAESFDENGLRGFTVPVNQMRSGSVFSKLLFYNFIPVLTVLVRRQVLDAVGYFDEDPGFKAIEDYDLWLRIAYRYPIHLSPELLARYRVHDDNLMYDVDKVFVRWDRCLRKTFQKYPVPWWLKCGALGTLMLRRWKYRLRRLWVP